jgi:hypothetical protein
VGRGMGALQARHVMLASVLPRLVFGWSLVVRLRLVPSLPLGLWGGLGGGFCWGRALVEWQKGDRGGGLGAAGAVNVVGASVAARYAVGWWRTV